MQPHNRERLALERACSLLEPKLCIPTARVLRNFSRFCEDPNLFGMNYLPRKMRGWEPKSQRGIAEEARQEVLSAVSTHLLQYFVGPVRHHLKLPGSRVVAYLYQLRSCLHRRDSEAHPGQADSSIQFQGK
jgi:hypothetical protein